MEEKFTGRTKELQRLEFYLQKALTGDMQICFITGEAGVGKTWLADAFVRKASQDHENLLVLRGNCSDLARWSGPYQPFRQILSNLVVGEERNSDDRGTNAQNVRRLQGLIRFVGRSLVEIAPDLIGTLIPGANIIVALTRHAAKERGLLKGLEEQVISAGQRRSELEPEQLIDQYTNFLRTLSQEHPLVIILEDLHWVDDASANLLFHFSRELRSNKIFFLCTYRAYDVRPNDSRRASIARILNEIKQKYGNVWIDFDSLEEAERETFVRELIDREPNNFDEDFYREIYQYTRGNALFVTELIKELENLNLLTSGESNIWHYSAPIDWEHVVGEGKGEGKVEAVIDERVSHLPEDLREMLRVASVQGQVFYMPVVAQIQKEDERSALVTLRGTQTKEGLIYEVHNKLPGYFAFKHKLFQQRFYRSLSRRERHLLHFETAKYMEEFPFDKTEQVAIRLAWHYKKADAPEKAIEHLLVAVKNVFELTAFGDAQGFLLEAQELLENHRSRVPEPDQYLLQIHFHLSKIFLKKGEIDNSREYGRKALDLARKTDDARTLVDILNFFGDLEFKKKLFLQAEEYLQEALRIAKKENYVGGEILSLIILARTYRQSRSRASEEVFKHFNRALFLARQTGDTRNELEALNGIAVSLGYTGEFEEQTKRYEEGLEIARKLKDKESQAKLLSNLVFVYKRLGEHGRALDFARQAYEMAIKIGTPRGIMYRLQSLANVYVAMHDYEGAVPLYQEAMSLADQVETAVIQLSSRNKLIQVCLNLGKVDCAEAVAQQVLGLEVDKSDSIDTFKWLGLVYLFVSRSDQAGKQFQSVVDEANRVLENAPKDYFALYSKGLALTGLSLLSTGADSQVYLSSARESYCAGLSIASARGIVEEELNILLLLEKLYPRHRLAPIFELLEKALL